MKPTYPNRKSSVRHQLMYAQQKLMMPNIPLELSAISYIRICCNAMRKYHRLKKAANPTKSISWDNQTPYLNLLGRLLREAPDWWATCYISDAGLLKSHNPKIQQLLQPLNAFVQAIDTPYTGLHSERNRRCSGCREIFSKSPQCNSYSNALNS